MAYVNPIPFIDTGKKFEMHLAMSFEEPVPVDEAKKKMAEYLLAQDADTLAGWISCSEIKPIYANELTMEQKKKFGLFPETKPNKKG